MNHDAENADKPDLTLNIVCAVLTYLSSFVLLGSLLFLIFWGSIIVALLTIITKSRRVRWAALSSTVAAVLTILWVLHG